MIDFVTKFCKPGVLIGDICICTSKKYEAFLKLSAHHQILECEKHYRCFQRLLSSFVNDFMHVMLREMSGLVQSKELFETSTVSRKGIDA